MTLSILYRGPLSSCNYDCSYCPFAKHQSDQAELDADRAGLLRFVDHLTGLSRGVRILFTPWGEALVRPWYPEALIRLSHLPHVERVAIQTNLSASLSWLDRAHRGRLAFWATYHPTEVALDRFVRRVEVVHERGFRISVGIVGTREHMPHAEALRGALPKDVYVWINAYKSEGPGYYEPGDVKRLTGLDPLFPINNERHPSAGEPCRAGSQAITVDGAGDIRRCHFIPEVQGNLYDDGLDAVLTERLCTNETCGCHIGYVHLDRLGLYDVFDGGLMERIPKNLPLLET